VCLLLLTLTGRLCPSCNECCDETDVPCKEKDCCEHGFLPLSKGVEDAVNAKHKADVGEPSCWVVSRIYREGVCDIAGEHDGDDFECCFNHLSILFLCMFSFCVFSDGSQTSKRVTLECVRQGADIVNGDTIFAIAAHSFHLGFWCMFFEEVKNSPLKGDTVVVEVASGEVVFVHVNSATKHCFLSLLSRMEKVREVGIVLANRFASYLRTGPYVIAFHVVDLFIFCLVLGR